MKISFCKSTMKLLLASTIAITPLAANLAYAPNTVHASGLELVSFHNQIYKKLTPSDIVDIKAANNNISKVNFNSVLGTSLVAKIDGKTAQGTAIKLASDFAKLQYQSNATDFLSELDAFEENHAADFNKMFDGEITVEQALSLASAFEENLKTLLVSSFLEEKNLTFDQIIKSAVDSTLADSRFTQFDGLFFQKLGITVSDVLLMKTKVDAIVDPAKMASAAFSSGLIRSQGGDIYGPATYALGSTAPSYSLKVDFGLGPIDFTNSLKWNTNNTSIATLTTGNKLVAKKTGKVKVVGYYLNQPIITKEIMILPKKDTVAPGTPSVNAFSNKDQLIQGKAEAYSTITVMNGKTLVATGQTYYNGVFALPIGLQKAGSVLTITAKDAAGNVSKAKTIKVLDKIAPATPTVYPVDNNDKTIIGKAEAYSYITIKSGKTTIATGRTTSKGTFSLSIKKTLYAGTSLSVTAKDAAGNVSAARNIKVLDRIAPKTPTVYSVDNNDKTIKGKAEASSIITIKNGKTVVATGKTSTKGNFSISIKKAQKAGSTLIVTAKDAAGNVSKAKAIKVLDKTAPAKPIVYSVDSNDKVIKGKAEAGSTITIKKGSSVLATGKTSSNGNFSVKIKVQKKGTVLYVTAKDNAKNVSSSTKVTVKSK